MKAIMIMYDSLNRHMLAPYSCHWTHTENFRRLARHTVTFDNCWVGSMPCMPARRELHTGRYNFLHRSWGPLEPFDDSMPEILKEAGIHTHLISDHYLPSTLQHLGMCAGAGGRQLAAPGWLYRRPKSHRKSVRRSWG